MNIPIVLAAFGTTTRALQTYESIGKVICENFPEHEICWAYSSRMVRDWIKVRRDIDLRHPHEVMDALINKSCKWAAVQSLHMMCGHEFYRLIEEIRGCSIRTSVGLPLLASPKDYEKIANILCDTHKRKEDEALVFVGHGTDHPSWSSYMAMNQVFSNKMARGTYVGMIEGEYLGPEAILEKIKQEGFKKVRLAPMMLVAGVHFEQDITGTEDSWQALFERAGYEVSIVRQGMGLNRAVVDVFCEHIREAISVIPDNLIFGNVKNDLFN